MDSKPTVGPRNGPVKAGDLVAVTGANGFIGSYLVRDLLAAGYRVRATVRDPSDEGRTAHLKKLATDADATDRLELVSGDLMKPGSFDEAIAGCDGVAHCAASVVFAAKDPQRDIVDPSVHGTRNVFGSVRRSGSVRRVVHTSSMAAVYGWDKPNGHMFTEADWNDSSTLETDPYGLAKVAAERAALEFVAALPQAERFELVHLNPGMVWGPPMIKAHAKASPMLVRDIISRTQPGVPHIMLGLVDVREVSAAHVAALQATDPPLRCLLVAENAWMGDLASRLQACFPDVSMTTRRIPKLLVLAAALFDAKLNFAQLRKLVGRAMPMDGALSKTAYGMHYRPVDETLHDTGEPMITNGWARVRR
jgi:nucleoside-diphosphate-sugar epimerase